jgi:Glycine transporter
MSGTITGCVGGVLRDVLCNDIPLLFQSELYASVSVAAGALYVGGLAAGDVQPGLGFLGLGPFSRENLGFEGWKGLDFLGFSRPNRVLSMGYDEFSLREISRALLPPRQNRGNGSPRFWPMERGLIDHGESLILFLIFCKKLLSEPFHSSRLHPKATRSESLIPGCTRLTVDLM